MAVSRESRTKNHLRRFFESCLFHTIFCLLHVECQQLGDIDVKLPPNSTKRKEKKKKKPVMVLTGTS